MSRTETQAKGAALLDSVALVTEQHAGLVIVTGSHGGLSAAKFALGVPLAGVIFNDAGVGKDGAGIAGLALLAAHDVPAAAISHASARIGDAADTFAAGIVSHVNEPARRLGVATGQSAREAVARMRAREP